MDYLENIKGYVLLAGQTIGVLKQAKDLLPQGSARDKAEKVIEEAEKSLELTEIKAAQALGYELCRCTWPPQICLRVDGHDNICPKCRHHAYHRLPAEREEF